MAFPSGGRRGMEGETPAMAEKEKERALVGGVYLGKGEA